MTIEDAHSERAAIAAFLRLKGSTRCPTAYVAPTCASITAADRMALQQHALDLERSRLGEGRKLPLYSVYWPLPYCI